MYWPKKKSIAETMMWDRGHSCIVSNQWTFTVRNSICHLKIKIYLNFIHTKTRMCARTFHQITVSHALRTTALYKNLREKHLKEKKTRNYLYIYMKRRIRQKVSKFIPCGIFVYVLWAHFHFSCGHQRYRVDFAIRGNRNDLISIWQSIRDVVSAINMQFFDQTYLHVLWSWSDDAFIFNV